MGQPQPAPYRERQAEPAPNRPITRRDPDSRAAQDSRQAVLDTPPGQSVFVVPFNKRATLIRIDAQKEMVVVQSGIFEMEIPLADIEPIRAAKPPEEKKPHPPAKKPTAAPQGQPAVAEAGKAEAAQAKEPTPAPEPAANPEPPSAPEAKTAEPPLPAEPVHVAPAAPALESPPASSPPG